MPVLEDNTALASGRLVQLLDRVIYMQVLDCIDLDLLADVEDHLAVALADRDDLSDDEVLELARGFVARALREIARRCEFGGDLGDYSDAHAPSREAVRDAR